MSGKPIIASWYDYPQYYDMAFRDDTAEEAAFLDVVWRKYCDFEVRRILEPACGTGRVLTALAQRGYEMLGFDLSDSMLRYASNRIKRRKLNATFFNADMRDFQLDLIDADSTLPDGAALNVRTNIKGRVGINNPVDMAYNPVNSFRYLLTENDAQQHLKCMADAIRPGGLYILAMHLLPMDVDEDSTERWTAKHGRTKLTATLRVLESDRRKRLEKLRISLLVRSGEKEFRLRHEFQFRMYTAAQMKRTLAAVPDFELLDVYDFWYDIDEPQVLNDVITDTVFVLKRR
jgi:SAM-dependent methyltransferase